MKKIKMRRDMISKISINSMINLMLADVEILEDDEDDCLLMQKELQAWSGSGSNVEIRFIFI